MHDAKFSNSRVLKRKKYLGAVAISMCVANDEKSCTDTEHDLHERTNKTQTHAFFLTNPHTYEDWWNNRATGRMSNSYRK